MFLSSAAQVVPARPGPAVARQHAHVGVQHYIIRLVWNRPEYLTFSLAGVSQHRQRLVTVAGEHHVIEVLHGAVFQRQLDTVMRHPLVGMSPLGGALRRVRIQQNGLDVNLAFDLPQERIDRLLAMLDSLDNLAGSLTGGAAGGLQLPPGVVPGLVPPDQLPDGPSAMAPEASDMAAAPAEAPESDMAAAP